LSAHRDAAGSHIWGITFDAHVPDDDERIGNALAGNGAASPSCRGKLGGKSQGFSRTRPAVAAGIADADSSPQALADGCFTVAMLREAFLWRARW
jgi:hypothetical protein